MMYCIQREKLLISGDLFYHISTQAMHTSLRIHSGTQKLDIRTTLSILFLGFSGVFSIHNTRNLKTLYVKLVPSFSRVPVSLIVIQSVALQENPTANPIQHCLDHPDTFADVCLSKLHAWYSSHRWSGNTPENSRHSWKWMETKQNKSFSRKALLLHLLRSILFLMAS